MRGLTRRCTLGLLASSLAAAHAQTEVSSPFRLPSDLPAYPAAKAVKIIVPFGGRCRHRCDGPSMAEAAFACSELLVLAFSQGVELKLAANVPQPRIGVNHLPHSRWRRKGSCAAHGALNFRNNFRCVIGRAHPVKSGDPSHAVNFGIQHAHCIQQRRHFALINTC